MPSATPSPHNITGGWQFNPVGFTHTQPAGGYVYADVKLVLTNLSDSQLLLPTCRNFTVGLQGTVNNLSVSYSQQPNRLKVPPIPPMRAPMVPDATRSKTYSLDADCSTV
jgi:hypothetical protein